MSLDRPPAEEFRKHSDYAVITSFPGLAEVTGARVLAEIGDDRDRFADDRALKAYAGSAPITRASGKVTSITHRRIKNDRLAAVGWVWATYASSTPAQLKTTTAEVETTATATPPPCDTCSTKCSASCITACKPAKHSTRSKPSDNHAPHPANLQRLDSSRNRRSVDSLFRRQASRSRRVEAT